MATVRAYMGTLRNWQNFVAGRVGTDLETAPVAIRATSVANAAIVGVVVKALVDTGVITDADLLAAAQSALTDAGWVPEENVRPEGAPSGD